MNSNSDRKDKPVVSVIVPVYNISDCIAECISSICEQTYKDLEIILVDDGSTDDSGDICESFKKKDERIIVIHKSNGGLVSARKAGMMRASGKYIATIDGDDWIDPDMFRYMVDIAERDTTQIVQTGYYIEHKGIANKYDDCQEFIDAKKRVDLLCSWLRNYPVLGSQAFTKLYERDLFIDCYSNVPDYMSFGEDWVFFVHLLSKICGFSSSSAVFYHHRYRSTSLSQCVVDYDYVINEDRLTVYVYSLIRQLFSEIDDTILGQWLIYRRSVQNEIAFRRFGYKSFNHFFIPDYDFLFDKRIVVYGAGKVGEDVISQLSKYSRIDIVTWIDKSYKDKHTDYREVCSPELIYELDYDYIVIAVFKEKIANEIKNELMSDYGVREDMIFWNIDYELCATWKI
ncbi:Glycosyltransferase involved in cell wall bisynthesis [Lachnospiraceae bacterium XBB2008]|nr:Glycosyltransferase involved in cell wall bisynthesis [Lachnospiraceae bacterium XBB2008]